MAKFLNHEKTCCELYQDFVNKRLLYWNYYIGIWDWAKKQYGKRKEHNVKKIISATEKFDSTMRKMRVY